MLHPKHCNAIETLVSELGRRWGIRIYRFANVGNHLHLLVRAQSRRAWQGFLRELTGGVAILVTGARKGQALARNPRLRSISGGVGANAKSGADLVRGFWDHLAFTRIVKFGRDFRAVGLYLIGNLFEAMGVPLKKLQAKGYRLRTIGPEGLEP
jgi:REP element-mobilizing transposase RayT